MIRPPGARTSPPINWSDRLVHGLRRRPVDRTVRRSLLLNVHFAADQLTRLFVARASSPATSVTPRRSDSSCSGTKWAHFTPLHLADIASYAEDSSVLGHRQRHRGLLAPRCLAIANDVRDHLVLGLLHRSTGRTAWFMDSVADQLIGLLAGRFYSMFTSPPTSRPECSSLVLHRQLRRLLLGPRILHARGLSGHTSPHGRR